jgi:predicted HTH transcriptional regulator
MANRKTPSVDDLIQQFADTLADAVREQVREAIIQALTEELGQAAPARKPKKARRVRAAPTAAPSTGNTTRVRRSADELALQKQAILDLVAEQPELRAETISRELGIPTRALSPLLKSLTGAGALTRSGTARGTRYRRVSARQRPPAAASTDAGSQTSPASVPDKAPAERDLAGEALTWIQNNPGDTTAIIAQALETSVSAVRSALQPMIDEGVIERQGEGRAATYAAR